MSKHNNMPEIISDEVKEGLQICTDQILNVLPEFTDRFQSAASEGLFYKPIENVDWTNGFWTGEIWLAYEFCKKNVLKEAALLQCRDYYKRIHEKIEVHHHDMGFLYSLSCVAAYKLTGSEMAKEAALMAADHLMTLYREKGEFIQSFDMPDCQAENRLIVDCLMNLPLLYWASGVTGDARYRDVAVKNYHTTQKYMVRQDGSVAQALLFELHTGNVLKAFTRQGYSDDSSWARGQSWAIYGSALTYKYTGLEECKDIFRRTANYFLEQLPEDLVAYFDLTISEGNEWPRDASASAIASCGMLEMVNYLEKEEADFYTSVAKKIVKALYDTCMVRDFTKSNGLLMHSTYCCNTPYNQMKKDGGKDECCSFGDYFYLEALTRLHKKWNAYW